MADIAKWWGENISDEWLSLRSDAYGVLQREDTLKEIVRLLGPEALPDEEKLILEVARMVRLLCYNKTLLMMLILIVVQKNNSN